MQSLVLNPRCLLTKIDQTSLRDSIYFDEAATLWQKFQRSIGKLNIYIFNLLNYCDLFGLFLSYLESALRTFADCDCVSQSTGSSVAFIFF